MLLQFQARKQVTQLFVVATRVLFFALLLWLPMTQPVIAQADPSQTIRFTTFNIHYISPRQKKLAWDDRKEAVRESIAELNADIIAFQEMETFTGRGFNKENKQLDWVLEHYPEYKAGAYGDAAIYPNTQPILYRHERFTQTEQGFFFFSETPDVIYSRTFNGSWPAFCSWSRLLDKKTGGEFYVYNLHFEYKSMSNRSKSAQLVSDRVKPVTSDGNPVVMMGDLNTPSWSPSAGKLKKTGLKFATPDGPTFHFNRGLNLLPAIDHILYSKQFTQTKKTERLRKKYDNVWPTDHYPVSVELMLNGS